MYEAHHGESAGTLAQTAVKSVEDALKLLRVSSHLGFSTSVDAALFRIQAVPWTTEKEASVAECISLLQVPVSKGLAARLKIDLQSLYLDRGAVRGGLVESWKRSVVGWRNAVGSYQASVLHSRSTEVHQKALNALNETMIKLCNSMFVLFGNAVSIGIGETLIQCLNEDESFQRILTELSMCSYGIMPYEAVLLVYLRIMRALSIGEVVCDEDLRKSMVCQCLTLFTRFHTYLHAQQNFVAKFDGTTNSLNLSDNFTNKHALDPDLDSYLRKYASPKSNIKRDLVSGLGQVLSTLKYSKGHIPIIELLQSIPSSEAPEEYFDEILSTFKAKLEVCITPPSCRVMHDG